MRLNGKRTSGGSRPYQSFETQTDDGTDVEELKRHDSAPCDTPSCQSGVREFNKACPDAPCKIT